MSFMAFLAAHCHSYYTKVKVKDKQLHDRKKFKIFAVG